MRGQARVERAARISNRLGSTPGGRRFARLHARLLRWSRGRIGSRWLGAPVIVLEVRGRRSGQLRRVPVLGLRDDGDLVVLAANAGSDRTPAWWLNLREAGSGVAIVAGERRAIVPRVLSGEERRRVWNRFVDMHPGTAHYAEFTDRDLPLIRLERTP